MSTADEQETPLDPDEPNTPLWFTFLGVAFFLFAGIFLLATSDDEEPAAASAVEAPAAEAAEGAKDGENPGQAPADPHAGHGHD